MNPQTSEAQVTLSLPVLRKGQHEGEPPVERLQFMLNFVSGVDEQRIIQAAAGFLLERQRADELPGKVDLDDVVAAYDGFIDEMRKRVSH